MSGEKLSDAQYVNESDHTGKTSRKHTHPVYQCVQVLREEVAFKDFFSSKQDRSLNSSWVFSTKDRKKDKEEERKKTYFHIA